ncbi:Mu transposase domain-containing protein [Olegusella massiliensis]|uniref:Mu transposase domain-containing protein n=1 Tax=Olegusella massiliensis TaxID=1776381 RepID=UPI000AB87923
MLGLPEASFNVVRYMTARADKQGKVQVDGRHFYSTDPALAGAEVIVALGATTVDVFTADGELVCAHERRYGSAPTDSTNPASQLPLLAVKLGAWANSQVRASIPDSLREYMDSQGRRDLAGSLRIMRDQVEASGWDAAIDAMEVALESTGRVDAASVAVAAARGVGGAITYDEPVDLAAYDEAIRRAV